MHEEDGTFSTENIVCGFLTERRKMKRLTVDIIIPTYRPQPSLREVLFKISGQDYPVGHILIINTEEKYWDPEISKDIPNVEVFHIPKSGFDHGASRNMGAGFSDADILIYMTQDAVPYDRKMVRNLILAFRRPMVKIAYARQIPNEHCHIIEGCIRNFNYPEKGCIRTIEDLDEYGIKTFFCSNVCAAYSHETLRELGGFPRPCIFNEDMIFTGKALKLGYAAAYVPEAKVIHSHNYTNIQQFHRNFDNGVSQAMHPEIFKGIRSEGEGRKLVHETSRYLRSVGRGYLIPQLYAQSFFKLLGFKMGRAYRHLPKSIVRACSLNKEFWDYQNPEETDEEE